MGSQDHRYLPLSVSEQAPVLEKKVRLSRFCHVLRRDNVVAIYHSLSIRVLYLDASKMDLINRLREGIVLRELLGMSKAHRDLAQAMIERLMLVDENDDETRIVRHIQQHFFERPKIGVLVLLVTDQCNFSCTYCVVESNIASPHRYHLMEPSTAQNAIDVYINNLTKDAGEPNIILYGGEPLLNFECVKFVLEYIDEMKNRGALPPHVQTTIVTNGSLIDEKMVDIFKRHSPRIVVSIDGPEDLHNKARRYGSGRGTFASTMRGFRMLQSAGLRPAVSCTIAEHNVDHLPAITRWIIKDLRPSGLAFNLLLDTPVSRASQELVDRMAQNLIECFEICRENGIYEDRMMRKVRAFVKGKLWLKDCAGYGNQIVVAPDGSVGVCQAYVGTGKFFSANVNENRHLDVGKLPPFVEWNRRSPLNMPQCQGCMALGICGGGCAYNADLRHGSIWALDDRFCVHALRSLEWAIWDLYTQLRLCKQADIH